MATKSGTSATPPGPDNLVPAGDPKEIEKQRKAEMREGRTSSKAERGSKDPEVAHRSMHVQLAPEHGGVVVPDQMTRRSDSDVAYGHFCTVVGGEHEGAYGVFTDIVSAGKDGYPDQVIVTTRDENNERLVVDYEHLRNARAGRR